MKTFFAVVLFLFTAVFPVTAQTYRGAINGAVTDPSGAVVPGAAVKATKKLPASITRPFQRATDSSHFRICRSERTS